MSTTGYSVFPAYSRVVVWQIALPGPQLDPYGRRLPGLRFRASPLRANPSPEPSGTGQASQRIHRLTASHAAVFLVNSRFPLVSAAPSSSGRAALHPTEVLLLPKLRRYFAEFLNHSSLDRLGILYPPT